MKIGLEHFAAPDFDDGGMNERMWEEVKRISRRRAQRLEVIAMGLPDPEAIPGHPSPYLDRARRTIVIPHGVI